MSNNNKKKVRFGIIDDDILRRRYLEDRIREVGYFSLDYSAESLEEVIKKEYGGPDYATDIIFLDMHWEHNGSEGLTIIDYLNKQPNFISKILVISSYSLTLIGNDLRRRPNVCGCISKELFIERNGKELFMDMIANIMQRNTPFFTDSDFYKVSPRELEITWRMSRGQSLTTIEREMGVAGIAETVRLLRQRFFCSNKELLILKMTNRGILTQPYIKQKFATELDKTNLLINL